MLASRSSRWVAGTVALCALLVLAFWFLLVSPRLAQASDLVDQRDRTVASNTTLEQEIQDLQAQSLKLPQRQAELAQIKREFPAQVLLATMIRDLDTMATQAGVTIVSLTPGTPVAVTPTAAAAPSGAAASGGAASGGAGTSAGRTPAAPASTGLLQVPVTIRVDGDYFQVATFTKRLQQQTRATLLTQVSLTPSQTAKSTPGTISATLTGAVFVLPDSDEAAAAATGAGSPGAPAAGTGGGTQ
jgi:type IV pilus assembly protein PilO